MGFTVLVALLLIAGAVGARRRWSRAHGMSDLDAEADANRWVVRLGSSLSTLDVRARARAGSGAGAGAGADRTAAQALTLASERLRTARDELATARTSAQYELVTRTAVEGLRHIRTARTSLGLDPESDPTRGPVFAGGGAQVSYEPSQGGPKPRRSG